MKIRPVSNHTLQREATKALAGLRAARKREDLPAIVGFTDQMDRALDELWDRIKPREENT